MNVGRTKWLLVIVAVIAGIVVAFAVLRSAGFISDYPPKRPANIPQDTEWAGGYDGGVWVKCSEVNGSDPQQFKCDIYGENGAGWLSQATFQAYKVTWDTNSNSAIYEETRLTKLDYSSWDGRFLRLQNGYSSEWLGLVDARSQSITARLTRTFHASTTPLHARTGAL